MMLIVILLPTMKPTSFAICQINTVDPVVDQVKDVELEDEGRPEGSIEHGVLYDKHLHKAGFDEDEDQVNAEEERDGQDKVVTK